MDIANIPVAVLGIIIFALIALFVIFGGFRLPADFFERDKQRAAMRRRLREIEETNKKENEPSQSAGAEKVDKKQETAESAKKPAATSSANPQKKN